jgi:hypothetical protein
LIFRLVILSGPRKGERITVPIEPMTIGRGSGCGLRIEDPEIAYEHAVVEHHNGGLLVRDLGSMGRTLVNKREVQRAILHHGDMIEVGRTSMLVHAFVQAEIAGGPAAGGAARRRRLVPVVATFVMIALAWWWWAGRRGGSEMSAAEPQPTTNAVVGGSIPESADPAPVHVPDPVPPPPQPVVVVTNRLPDDRTAEELRHLREELATIKSAFHSLATQQVKVAEVPPPVAAPVSTQAPAPAAPTRAERSAALLESARSRVAAGKADAADEILAQLQAEDPGFLPAYPLRASIFEQRGMPDKAIGQWALLLQRAAGKPEADRAAGEWARLTQEQRRVAVAPARRIRIRDLALRRFPDSEDYDDMRLVRVTIEASGTPPPPSSLKIEVVFFDEDTRTGTLTLTRAMSPRVEAQLPGAWQPDGTLGASAAYVVRAGFRTANRCRFHGYVVRVYAAGVLQDEAARPLDLLAQPVAATTRKNP